MNAKIVVTPRGERLAIMPAEEYEDMRDALLHRTAVEAYRAGRTQALTLEETRALLAAPTPLAFWRAKRGISQAALAKAARTTRSELTDLETGEQRGSLEVMARIASALNISVDELVIVD